MPVGEYFNELCSYVPHENRYLVKCRSTKFPYQNYHLFSKINLDFILHSESPVYKIQTERNGFVSEYALSLEEYNGCADFLDSENFAGFEIIDRFAVLRLDECKLNQTYRDTLEKFFEAVHMNQISKILIDLSENMGGNSGVLQEFMKHLNIESYGFYGVDIRNEKELTHALPRNNLVINEKETANLFDGKLNCAISNTTFSSARIFAAVLKDNHLAVLAGENSGGKPSSYGAPTKFKTPNLNIRFRVSARTFFRPDETKDNEDSLIPDIFVPRKLVHTDRSAYIRDIIQSINRAEK